MKITETVNVLKNLAYFLEQYPTTLGEKIMKPSRDIYINTLKETVQFLTKNNSLRYKNENNR